MIPYFVPQMVPVGIGSPIGGIGSPILGGVANPGLLHSGAGMGGLMQPIYRSPGMIPYGYGYGSYGLLHSGPEIQGIGGIGPIGYGGYGQMGYGSIGYIPVGPQIHGIGGPGIGQPMIAALQPAWSTGTGVGFGPQNAGMHV